MLKGDLSVASRTALELSMLMDMKQERAKFVAMTDRMESLFDAWLSVEHNKIWEHVSMERAAREQAMRDERDNIDLSAPDMASMLESLRRMADMAGEAQ